MKTYSAVHDPNKCTQCGMCGEIVACPGSQEEICIGCGSCVLACPSGALRLVEEPREKDVSIEIDGKSAQVPERISVEMALEELGYWGNPDKTLGHISEIASCQVGACWNCVVTIDETVQPACHTPVRDGMKIKTSIPSDYVPKRVVGGFMPHPVGGVGTPWQIKNNHSAPVEAVCFASGCNFRCPQCQNWAITFNGQGEILTARQAAERLTQERAMLKVTRMTISGGECTLNRTWLLEFLRELKALNPDNEARFHVDTNGSLLTPDYIDDLVKAGMTDVGIDLKANDLENFLRITGLHDSALAEKHKETAWAAVEYIFNNYRDKVFVGVGFPYNRSLNTVTHVKDMAERLYKIDPNIQVTVLNYRPEFRSTINLPEDTETKVVQEILQKVGLTTVLYQTTDGSYGP